MTDPEAYKCEVYIPSEDDWVRHMGRDHPRKTFDQLEYRNVVPLVAVEDSDED